MNRVKKQAGDGLLLILSVENVMSHEVQHCINIYVYFVQYILV